MTGARRQALLRRLKHSRSGVAATEFALTLPFLLGGSLFGLELANQAVVQMQVSQLAVHVADNASRIGDTSTLEDRKIYESDLIDLFVGAHMQGGGRIDLYEHGRVIVSSLEVVPGTEDRQYIHWQRCMGKKIHSSRYGDAGDGLDGGLAGMGPIGEEVISFADEAVMFVEIAYDYQPLIGEDFALTDEMVATASFTVRDDRDLSQVYQRNPGSPDVAPSCNLYGGTASQGG